MAGQVSMQEYKLQSHFSQNYSKIIFEYESLVIFAGNTKIFSEIVFEYESGHFRGDYSKRFMSPPI